MNKEDAKGYMGCLALIVVIAAIAFLYFGGWTWLFGAGGRSGQETATEPAPPPPDPVYSAFTLGACRACADGTMYMTTRRGEKVFWLVAGKVTTVECSERLGDWSDCRADARGGLYVGSGEHLWYLFNGQAAQVKEVPMNEIAEADHCVTARTVNWSVLEQYGQAAYAFGEEAAREESASEPE